MQIDVIDDKSPFVRLSGWATESLVPRSGLLLNPTGRPLSQEIQSLLTNWKGPDLTSYGELVLEGTFRLQRAKNERTLFLLDKLLLITKKRDDTFTYKAHILVGVTAGHLGDKDGPARSLSLRVPHLRLSPLQCGNLMLVEVIPKEPLSFSVFHYKNPKLQHTVQVGGLTLSRPPLVDEACWVPGPFQGFLTAPGASHLVGGAKGVGLSHIRRFHLPPQAKSQQDKRLWVLHLKRLILENHAAKIPAKVRGETQSADSGSQGLRSWWGSRTGSEAQLKTSI